MTANEEYRDGRWQPSVPLPLFCGPLARCRCGRWFLRNSRYERHYRHRHIRSQDHD